VSVALVDVVKSPNVAEVEIGPPFSEEVGPFDSEHDVVAV
jgi:hypothetical protein